MRQEISSEAVSVEGLIRLDVAVADDAGKAVPGLRRTDFKVYDNGQPQNIIAFRESDGIPANTDDSLTVVLLIDTLDLSADLAAVERQQTVEFLRRSAGYLAHPVTVYSLDDSGFFLTAKPSTDADMLAKDVISNNKVDAYFLAPQGRSQFKTAVADASFDRIPALTGLRALGTIATAEDAKPGRKLLLWVGPGMSDRGTGAYAPNGRGLMSNIVTPGTKSREAQRDLFEKIRWFSTLLRQARVTVDCLSVAEDGPTKVTLWRQYLAGVPSAEQANYMNLYKKVLTVQTGGRVLQVSGDLARQLDDCIHHAGSYYTLTFDPPLATRPDEYHSLKIDLSRPGLNVRTSTGYYDQPFYDDPPDPAIRLATVAQLEQIIQGEHGGASLARQLSSLALTDRLSHAKLQSLLALARTNQVRESLEMIADESAFLEPPSSEIPADPPPDPTGQQMILAAAADYLSRVIPKLPDFFAIRTAVYYREVAAYPGLHTASTPMPIHAEQRTKDTVLYRHGAEIVEALTAGHTPVDGQPLTTYGTFGPILRIVRTVLKTPGSVTWEHWESSVTGRRAVFHFGFARNPMANLIGCCFPDGQEKSHIGLSTSSHGEIAIDPSSGAILRVQMESDVNGFIPVKRSDLLVSYGPVEIDGNTYILPLRSVNIERGRMVVRLSQWNLGFPTWGPYETQMNVFTFDSYHMFRGNARMLSGFDPQPEKGSKGSTGRPSGLKSPREN
jgi:VWFA-related protein